MTLSIVPSAILSIREWLFPGPERKITVLSSLKLPTTTSLLAQLGVVESSRIDEGVFSERWPEKI